jgi:hypothetical protein
LSLEGDAPGERSLGSLVIAPDLKDKLSRISFGTEIIRWLGLCIREEETLKIAVIRETLLQYISLLKKLTNQCEEGIKMETVKLITASKENFKSALEIE